MRYYVALVVVSLLFGCPDSNTSDEPNDGGAGGVDGGRADTMGQADARVGDGSGQADAGTQQQSGLCGPAGPVAGELSMSAASTVVGVAPLAVHFSAVGDGSGVAQPAGGDFDNLTYAWNFGDSLAEVWSDGASGTCATGFVAGHVFVTPGSYTVRLTVTSADLQRTNYYQDVTVLDPDAEGWTTLYVASDGLDSNSGDSEGSPLQTIAHAFSQAGPNTRILFKRGDSWQSDTVTLNLDGPGIFGAYGQGAHPHIQFSAGHGVRFGWASGNRGWRFVDLHLEGSGNDAAVFAEGTQVSELLLLNMKISRWGSGVVMSAGCADMDQIVVARSSITDIRSAWTIYMGGTRSFVQGNHLDKQTTDNSHTYRNWCASGLSVSHNSFAPAHHHCLKLHSPRWSLAPPYSKDIVIADNVFEGGTWSVAIGPQDSTHDERVENVLYERNTHLRTSDTGVALMVWASDVTVRNNVFVNNLTSSYQAMNIDQRGTEPAPANNRVYHNTFLESQGSIVPVLIGDSASATDVRNNLLAPRSSDFAINGSGSALVQSNNVASTQPGFVGAGPEVASGSMVSGTAADVGVLHDYDGVVRAVPAAVGAFEPQ